MPDILFVVAMPEEAIHLDLPSEVEVLVTGPGKVDAALGLSRRLSSGRSDALTVVNLGTAGSPIGLPAGLYFVAETRQWDYPAELLAQLTRRPGFDRRITLHVPNSFRDLARVGATADQFVNDPTVASELARQGIELVDMETYAYAAAATLHGVRFIAAKYVTDGADGMAASDWLKNLRRAGEALSVAARALVEQSPTRSWPPY